MTRVIVVHCDAPGCPTHASRDMARKSGFVAVHWDGARFDYCSTECCLRHLARLEPIMMGSPSE